VPFRQKRLPTPVTKARSRTIARTRNPITHLSLEKERNACTRASSSDDQEQEQEQEHLEAAECSGHHRARTGDLSRRKKNKKRGIQTKPSAAGGRTIRPSSLCMEVCFAMWGCRSEAHGGARLVV
jgi:hypothetical protein